MADSAAARRESRGNLDDGYTMRREVERLREERDMLHEAICDYVDAYESGDPVLAGSIYDRLYEIATEDEA